MASEKKKKDGMDNGIVARIPDWGRLIISCLTVIVLWYRLSISPKTARSFPFASTVFAPLRTMIERGMLWNDFKSSMISVVLGFTLGFVTSVPVVLLVAWYRPMKYIVEPWTQSIRSIPPLAHVPLVVISAGAGRRPQIIAIWLVILLIMTATIYQGVRNAGETLTEAARVLGTKDRDLFVKVIFPATTSSIITAVRLGAPVAPTILTAVESTGAIAGLGMRTRSLNNSFGVPSMLLYIVIIGTIGITSEKIIKYLEREFTGWQETRDV